MNRAEIRALIEQAFPFVPRPSQHELSFHGDDCPHCAMSREYLDQYSGPELPVSAVRYLFDELTTLSPKGMAWVLPSYLRHIIDDPESLDTSTEYLIYNLGPKSEFEKETAERLSLLSSTQLRGLIELVQYWRQSERWGEYCPKELERALHFLQSRASDA